MRRVTTSIPLWASLSAAEPENLVANPGFEVTAGAQPSALAPPWINQGEDVAVVDDQAHSGRRAARIQIRDRATLGGWQAADVLSGQKMQFEGDVLAVPLSRHKGRVILLKS